MTTLAESASTTGYALEMRAVTKIYRVADDEVVALDHVDLTVASDEIVALVGPSGSGKTTLCSIAGGLLSPTDGSVAVAGQEISGYSGRQLTEFRRASVGFVFQTVNLIPFLTARENLLVVDEIGPRLGRVARDRADLCAGQQPRRPSGPPHQRRDEGSRHRCHHRHA